MKEILLPCGKRALIDDDDWDRVARYSWYDRGGGYVAARNKRSLGGDGRLRSLHHFVYGQPPDGMVIDHIDGNPLNNQKSNLQLTTQSRNSMKSRKALGGGVHQRGPEQFEARVRIDKKIIRLGTFPSLAAAQKAVKDARDAAWAPGADPLGTVPLK